MQHVANPECAMRLDRYLRYCFPGITQSAIEKSIRKGLIKINNTPCLAKDRILGGETLSLPQSFAVQDNSQKVMPIGAQNLAKKLFNSFAVHEDTNILVINKPAKLATQGGSKINLSIDDAIKYHNNCNGLNLRIVHRLDKDTTGLLLIAKHRMVSSQIAHAFTNHLIQKKYLALFWGKPRAKAGWIKSEIDDKEAISYYRVVKKISNNLWCILFAPQTGKMHQLRKHALLIGGAIVGDQKYNLDEKSPYCSNLMLHASYLVLPSSIENLDRQRFHAPIPNHWSQFLSKYC
jgi:23S rRNA pseudouridine955/2504/2580 synthase